MASIEVDMTGQASAGKGTTETILIAMAEEALTEMAMTKAVLAPLTNATRSLERNMTSRAMTGRAATKMASGLRVWVAFGMWSESASSLKEIWK